MTTSKLIDNNRRVHAAKVLAESSKKNQIQEEEVSEIKMTKLSKSKSKGENLLNEQYQIIREDVLKLREDLAHGYDLLKDYIESKVNLRTFIRAK